MVVLATKLYIEGDARERALDSLTSLASNVLGDLDVEFDVGIRDDDFPSITVDGPDATVARNLLREEFGEVVPDLEDGEIYTGTLQRWDDNGFVLDAGFGNGVRISAENMNLGPGDAKQIRKRYGLVQHIPLRFVNDDPATLAEVEQDRLYEWTRGTGRVNVNSATRAEARATVNRAGHAQDIVTVERIGLLEQSIICGEGTDPPGLLSSIGEYLPAELLCIVP